MSLCINDKVPNLNLSTDLGDFALHDYIEDNRTRNRSSLRLGRFFCALSVPGAINLSHKAPILTL